MSIYIFEEKVVEKMYEIILLFLRKNQEFPQRLGGRLNI